MASADNLTKREKECYHYLGNGFKQVEIATLLFTTDDNVRQHLHKGKNKLNARSPTEAHGKLVEAGKFTRMHYDEKQLKLKRLKELQKKFPKKKK